jgi:hypothetical protein
MRIYFKIHIYVVPCFVDSGAPRLSVRKRTTVQILGSQGRPIPERSRVVATLADDAAHALTPDLAERVPWLGSSGMEPITHSGDDKKLRLKPHAVRGHHRRPPEGQR